MRRLEEQHQAERLAGVASAKKSFDVGWRDFRIDMDRFDQVVSADANVVARFASTVRGAVTEVIEWSREPVEIHVTTVGFVKVVRLLRLAGPVVKDGGTLVSPLRRIANSPLSKESRLVACRSAVDREPFG